MLCRLPGQPTQDLQPRGQLNGGAAPGSSRPSISSDLSLTPETSCHAYIAPHCCRFLSFLLVVASPSPLSGIHAFTKMKNVLALFALATAALAQSSTSTASSAAASSTAGISACILQCSSDAASTNGCSSVTDLQCMCTSSGFQNDAASCMQENCTEAEMEAALQLQATECAAIASSASDTASAPTATSSGSVTSSGTQTSSDSASSSTGPSSAEPSASATDSNAATARATSSFGYAVAIAVSIVGTVFGGALVL
ncbi:hypothetical protein BD626DRAFT_489979 [Schizophyllum amplum]|uniref:CFEM domain-containing protein n=1 Tax=Schizophyllum amplum TaxID=97359 RepID=A0A550CJ86_9AGAR|nr:hypothetical protein BD626DRAFT_489979 [Auriculariopsis ampla]